MKQTPFKTPSLLKALLLFLLIAHCIPISSQETDFLRHELSIHTGYGNMVNDIAGLTLNTHNYRRNLSEGISWDGQYHFRPIQRLAVGVFYSGFSSKGSHAEGSDHLFINYFAPQISVCSQSYKRWQFRLGAGAGVLFFRDNSKVFGKPRRVTNNKLCGHLNFNSSYKLTAHWGIGVEAQYILGKINSIDSYYHGETIHVKFKEGNEANISRLNIVAGLSYYF